MFVRKKRNKSGSVSVQIIDKSKGYRVFKTIGSSKNPEKIKQLVARGWDIIQGNGDQARLFSFKTEEERWIEDFLSGLSNAQVHTIGPEPKRPGGPGSSLAIILLKKARGSSLAIILLFSHALF